MTAREARIAHFVTTRPMAAILAAIGFVLLSVSYVSGSYPPPSGFDRGLVFDSPSEWFASSASESFGFNFAGLVVLATLMMVLNSSFNILRSFSVTFVGLFVIMTAATPASACAFTGATLLAVTVLSAMTIMLTVYGRPSLSRRVFMAFFLVALGGLTQYAFIPYLLVLTGGIFQMRVGSGKTLLAGALGVITPLWLVWAFWPTTTLEPPVHMPDFTYYMLDWPFHARLVTWVTAGTTLVLGVMLGVSNMVRIYSYNAKARAINGLLTVVGIMTVILTLADYTNMPVYIVLLNVCTAFQAGHFCAIHERQRSYLVMVGLALLYTGFWIWNII